MVQFRGQDVVELFARDQGYSQKCEKDFNLSEWYGFTNGEKILRAKYIETQDKNRCYNVHFPSGDNLVALNDKSPELYCIIQTNDKFTVKKIRTNPLLRKIIFDENLAVRNGDDVVDKNFEQEFEQDGRIYKIRKINETIAAIRQRVDIEENINERDIGALLQNPIQKCSYCGISPEQVERLNQNAPYEFGLTIRGRGKKLEIDQLIPKKGYIEGNMTLCCYWCNNAKTDTFSPKEFKEIARGINRVWNEKLKQIAPNETIYFEENSTIWDVDHDSQLEK